MKKREVFLNFPERQNTKHRFIVVTAPAPLFLWPPAILILIGRPEAVGKWNEYIDPVLPFVYYDPGRRSLKFRVLTTKSGPVLLKHLLRVFIIIPRMNERGVERVNTLPGKNDGLL